MQLLENERVSIGHEHNFHIKVPDFHMKVPDSTFDLFAVINFLARQFIARQIKLLSCQVIAIGSVLAR